MKKYIAYFLGVVGTGLIGYSLSQGWASWVQSTQFGLGVAVEPTPGYGYWQGIAAGIFGLLGLVLLFIKPRFAIAAGIVAAGLAAWLHFSPPMIEETVLEPQKAIFYSIGGGVLIALAGLIAPKK